MSSTSFKALGYAVILGSALMASAVPKAGQVTWYDPKGVVSQTGIGACGGAPLDETMPIAALAKAYYDSYPGATGNSNNNPLCGKEISVTIRGKSVKVAVRDRCDSCEGPFDVDLSHSSFSQLTDPGAGRVQGTWDFVNPADDIGMKPGDGGSPPGPDVPGQPAPNPTDPTDPTDPANPGPPATDPSHPSIPGNTGNKGPESAAIPATTTSAPVPKITSHSPGRQRPVKNKNGPADPKPGPQMRSTPAVVAGTARRPSSRRMNRITKNSVNDAELTKRGQVLKRAVEPEIRPRRLSRIMRGLVLEGQN